jgi:hypothetical protein
MLLLLDTSIIENQIAMFLMLNQPPLLLVEE